MYSLVHEKKIIQTEIEVICMKGKKRAEGVSKVVVQSSIQHEDHKTCLFDREFQMDLMVAFIYQVNPFNEIMSKNQHVYL